MQAALSGRCCSDLLHGLPLPRRKRRALPRLPAPSEAKKLQPSSVSTTCRALPLLLARTRTVPASGLKSSAVIAASSPYRQPVSSAPETRRRKSAWQALVNRRASASERYRSLAASASRNARTVRHASSLPHFPSWCAWLSAAFRIVSTRFAVERRRLTASGLLSAFRCFCSVPTFVRSRGGVSAIF